MKTLIIHPKDPTTDFLSPIYASLNYKTVITGGITKSALRELIEAHDRILCMGHGSPYGLLSRGQFIESGLYIVDESMVTSLKNKSNSIFIWCYADQFVHRHGLSGFCTGMFISELGEADYWGFENIDQAVINQSNERFSTVISKYIAEPLYDIYSNVLFQYRVLAKVNPIALFNLNRLFLAD